MRRARMLQAAALAAAVTVGVLLVPAADAATPSFCADVMVIGMPGSTEGRQNGRTDPYGQVVSDVLSALQGQSSRRMRIEAVDYPATLEGYSTSKNAGYNAAYQRIADWAKACPRAKFGLVGYSQSAHILGDLASSIARKGAPVRADRLAGVALVADPAFTPWSRPHAERIGFGYGFGLFGPRIPFSRTLPVRSVCLAKDPICDSTVVRPGGGGFERALRGAVNAGTIHTSYTTRQWPGTGRTVTREIGRWLAAALAQVGTPYSSVPELRLDTASLPTADVGTLYSAPLRASGGTAPYRWRAEGLPPGLLVRGAVIEGVPLRSGRFTVDLTVFDESGQRSTARLTLGVGTAAAGTRRISVAPDGSDTTGESAPGSLSADGSVAVFSTGAPELTGGSGTYAAVVSDTSEGTRTALPSRFTGTVTAEVSGDGRVVYASGPGLSSGYPEMHVHERGAGADNVVRAADGRALRLFVQPFVSADGRYVVVQSDERELTPGNPDGISRTFRYDRMTGAFDPVALTDDERPVGPGNNQSDIEVRAMSADGTRIVFSASSADLPRAADLEEFQRTFWTRDLVAGTTTPYLLPSNVPGAPARPDDRESFRAAISADGGFAMVTEEDGNPIAPDRTVIRDQRTGTEQRHVLPAELLGNDACLTYSAEWSIADNGRDLLGDLTCPSRGDGPYPLVRLEASTGRYEIVEPTATTARGRSFRPVTSGDHTAIMIGLVDTGVPASGSDPGDRNGVDDVYVSTRR